MDVVLLCLAILAVAAYVAGPLYRSVPAPTTAPGAAKAPGETAGAQAADRALADLEIDRASGLIDEATYARERAALDPSGRPND